MYDCVKNDGKPFDFSNIRALSKSSSLPGAACIGTSCKNVSNELTKSLGKNCFIESYVLFCTPLNTYLGTVLPSASTTVSFGSNRLLKSLSTFLARFISNMFVPDCVSKAVQNTVLLTFLGGALAGLSTVFSVTETYLSPLRLRGTYVES